MLDHMIFDRLKWFNISDNTDSVTANGKNWEAIPKQVVLPQGAKIATFSGDGSASAPDAIIMLNSDTTANVIGKIIRESDVKSTKWGGKNLLHTVASMVERAFSSIRKGAKTC